MTGKAILGGNRRTAQRLATRFTILSRTIEQARTQGFVAVRTADVAQAAGVSHGAVFAHFATRDVLLAEAASSIGRDITDTLHAAAEQSSEAGVVLRAHLAAIRRQVTAYRSLLLDAAGGGALRDVWTGIQSAVALHVRPALQRALGVRARGRAYARWFNTWLALVHHHILNYDLLGLPDSLVDFYLDDLTGGRR